MKTEQPAIVIRDIERIDELRSVEDLQKQVWGVEDREVLPALAMIPMREVGAIIVGAFAGEKLVGFVFGFPGQEEGRLIIHSDMLAVVPEFRSHGLGYQLKLAQRERALARGIDTITWTFDPLQSLNAFLNFSKLGVTSGRYLVDYYGATSSFLHSNGTDRLWVKWHLNSQRVIERIAGQVNQKQRDDIPVVVKVRENEEPVSVQIGETEAVIIEIPININEIQSNDIGLARKWRAATRDAFARAIERGFVVEEFSRIERAGKRAGCYLLVKRDLR